MKLKSERQQKEELIQLVRATELKCLNTVSNDHKIWEQHIENLSSLADSELNLKQREVIRLHDLMAEWLIRYLHLGQKFGLKSCRDLESLFVSMGKEEGNLDLVNQTQTALADKVRHSMCEPHSSSLTAKKMNEANVRIQCEKAIGDGKITGDVVSFHIDECDGK